MDNKKIGLFLQGLRKERKMTQLDLATYLNVTHQTVSKWENGDSIPDIATLLLLANFYQITIDEILVGESNTPVAIQVDETLHTDKLWVIARLVSSVMIFLSLFFYYLSYYLHPIAEYNHRGFSLVFNATKLTLITGGALFVFLSSLVLMAIFGLVTYSVFYKKELFVFIKENTYLMIKKISEIILIVGFIIILIGVNFGNTVHVNIGYIIGFLFAIGLFAINFIEQRYSTQIN